MRRSPLGLGDLGGKHALEHSTPHLILYNRPQRVLLAFAFWRPRGQGPTPHAGSPREEERDSFTPLHKVKDTAHDMVILAPGPFHQEADNAGPRSFAFSHTGGRKVYRQPMSTCGCSPRVRSGFPPREDHTSNLVGHVWDIIGL